MTWERADGLKDWFWRVVMVFFGSLLFGNLIYFADSKICDRLECSV